MEVTREFPVITGNAFRSRCFRVTDQFGYREQPECWRADMHFVKTDYLLTWAAPKHPYILLTHNADYTVPYVQNYSPVYSDKVLNRAELLDDANLICWLGQNIGIKHPKLRALPIGLENKPHIDPTQFPNEAWLNFRNVAFQASLQAKTNLVTARYALSYQGRQYPWRHACQAQTGIQTVYSKQGYVEAVAASMFSLSPPGNGEDCHRTWEALYYGSIPVVLRSPHMEDLARYYPIVLLDAWTDAKRLLTPELYDKMWDTFDQTLLLPDVFLKRVLTEMLYPL